MKRVSIVIPCHNEESALRPLFAQLGKLRESLVDVTLEAVLVNDGSEDGTLALMLEESKSTGGELVVVDLSRNFGKESALSAGLATATGDAVVVMDADLQDPPELIHKMLELWSEGADVVVARRLDRSSDSWFKRASARAFYKVHGAISDVDIPSDVGDFRLMDRAVVDVVNALPENRRYMKGLFAWAGFRTRVIEYARPPRSSGSSSFGTIRLLHLALEGITSFSLAPLRIATLLGLLVALVSLVQGGWILVRTLLYGVDVPGYASIFTAVVFLGGVQLICLGIIGEYVGRTYLEAKRRPSFIVRRVYKNRAGAPPA